MFNSQIIDVAIGLIFFYLFVSLAFTALNEWIAALSTLRATGLRRGIKNLLQDKSAIENFYNNPLIKSMNPELLKGKKWHKKKPSYLPSKMFAIAIVDDAAKTLQSFDAVRASIVTYLTQHPESAVHRQLLALIDASQGKMDVALKNIGEWFDGQMERISGWYKRVIMCITAVIALIVATALNADSIMIAKQLWGNAVLRTSVVRLAEQKVSNDADTILSGGFVRVEKLSNELSEIGFPLGWEKKENDAVRSVPGDIVGWINKILGLLFTSLAVTLGAPFWFDLLGKFVRIRASGNAGAKPIDEK